MVVLTFAILPSLLESHASSNGTELFVSVLVQRNVTYLGNLVQLSGIVKFTNETSVSSAAVGLEVRDANNNLIFLDIVYSSENGMYNDIFRLPNPGSIGEYNATASAAKSGCQPGRNSTIFLVQFPGDVTGDGIVDISDGAQVGLWWFETVPPAPANVDINGDGIIDISDGAIIGLNWLKHA